MRPDDDSAAGTRIFVGNLPNTVNEDVLRNEFSIYGTVDKVDLKSKGFGELQSQFAFVTLKYTTQQDISKCLKRFANNEFHGQYLKVDIARENFLDRLKRERSEREATQSKKDSSQYQKPTAVENHQNNQNDTVLPKIQKKTFSKSSSSSSSSERDSDGEVKENDRPKNHTPKTPNNLEQRPIEDQTLFITKKNAYSSVLNGKIKIGTAIAEPIHVISKKSVTKNILEGTAKQSDQKRKESLHKMKDQYNKQKLAIKEALTNLDSSKKSSKIVFDDEIDTNAKSKSNVVQESSKRELFNDNDSGAEPEDYSKDFKVKEQFQGEKGEKLMKLQSKFKLDPRFAMDERFLEEDGNVTSDKKKSNSKVKTKTNDERNWQLSLIEQVVGTKLNVEKPVQKKPMIGLITRFDPTKEEHKKFYKSEKEADIAQPIVNKVEAETNDAAETVEVPQERFYKVSSDLKDILHSDNKGFSLLSMFGRAEENTRNDDTQEYTELPLKKSQHTAIALNNPFKYDSSDSEDEDNEKKTRDKSSLTEQVVVLADKTKPNGVNKMGIPIERFFLDPLDKRLNEGTAFFKAPEVNPDLDYVEVKRKLRTIIQRKIQKKRKFTEGFSTSASKFKKKRRT